MADLMGNNSTKNTLFTNAFNAVCAENGLDQNDRELRREAHDALPGDYWEDDKDSLTFQQLKDRIKESIVNGCLFLV